MRVQTCIGHPQRHRFRFLCQSLVQVTGLRLTQSCYSRVGGDSTNSNLHCANVIYACKVLQVPITWMRLMVVNVLTALNGFVAGTPHGLVILIRSPRSSSPAISTRRSSPAITKALGIQTDVHATSWKTNASSALTSNQVDLPDSLTACIHVGHYAMRVFQICPKHDKESCPMTSVIWLDIAS